MRVLQDDTGTTKPINYLIKFGITIGLLFLIIRSVNPGEALRAIMLITPSGMLLALALQLASNSVAAFRWHLIMQRIGFTHPYSFYLKSYFKGSFFNQGLPTSIGGDGIRILDCTRLGGSALDSFYGVFIDRIIGLAGLLILNIGALLFNSSLLPDRIYYLLLAILTLLFTGLVSLFFLRRFRIFSTGRWLGLLGSLSEKYFQVYSNFRSIALQLFLSVVIHMFAMAAFYTLGINIGLDFPLSVYLVLVPPVILLIILPISLAGWGIREGAMIGFFLLIGADRTKVLSFSLLYGLIALVASLPGLLVYLSQKNKI
jgi:uncharacterized membrane protein YbhN (UPF0104 family)